MMTNGTLAKRYVGPLNRCLVIALFALAVSTVIVAAPPEAIIFSPDITIVLGSETVDDENAAEDSLDGSVALLDAGGLPANVDVQVFHRTADSGDWFVLDTSVSLPGGVLSTPRKVIGIEAGVFSEVVDLGDCGLPDGVQIDAMTVADTMWFSFDGAVTLGGTFYDDEDVVALGGGCSWSLPVDGSAVGVDTSLDIDGIHWQADDAVLLISFDGTGSVGAIAFDDEDVLSLDIATPSWAMIYDGSAVHSGGEWNPADLDALSAMPVVEVEPPPGPESEPRLIVSPLYMEFVLSQVDGPASRQFTLRAVDGTLGYSIRPGASWLSSSPTTGSSIGETDSALAIVDARGMRPGMYQRPLFIRSTAGVVQIMVKLTVTPGSLPPVPGPSLPENAAVNAASMTPFGQPGHPMSPQSAIAIFGSAFAEGDHLAESVPLPLELGGVSVTFDGVPAGMFFSSQGQLLVQLPGGLLVDEAAAEPDALEVTGAATMVVTNANGTSQERTVQLHTFSPAIYTLLQTGNGQGIVLFSNTNDLVAPAGTTATSRPATEGDLLTIYSNGLGPVDPEIGDMLNSCDPDGICAADFSNVVIRNTVTKPVVTIGGVTVPEADVLFSGLSPLFVGLNEVIVRTPGGVAAGDAVSVVIEMGSVSSRADVTIAVR